MSKTKTKAELQMEADLNRNTLIGAGTIITGHLISSGDIRIDGILTGNISGSARIIVGHEGVIEGDIECVEAEIHGKIKGNLTVHDTLYLKGNAMVEGDIVVPHLSIEGHATFNGRCTMSRQRLDIDALTRQEHAAPAN